jgi:alpha-N-arabinofuranosidase
MKLKFGFGLALLIGLVFALKSPVYAENIISTSTTPISLISGTYEGSAYLSNDNSSSSGNKVTFGNPNYLIFSNTSSIANITKITTGNPNNYSTINRSDYGANIIWYDGGYGLQNLSTNNLFSNSAALVNEVGVTSLRYPGGIPSDTFHWYNAIGKQQDRKPNVVYQGGDTFFPSTFGPDEYGSFLQSTKNSGDITVNFGTGTATEAADWVQYMTSNDKNNYWAQLRIKNGHSEPYKIPYWEVGNETEASSGENYWRSGSLVSLNTTNGVCPVEDVNLCEYVYGGTTQFHRQKTISENNSTGSDGSPNQSFYVEYPPVVNNSQTIYINGVAWRKVGNISQAGPYDNVYQIDNTTGQIIFGDGTHGKIPVTGSNITASYESGTHDGFLEYYKEMKAANPGIKVCSAYDSPSFIQLMGSEYAYDCIVTHLYTGSVPSTNSSISDFHNELIEQSFGFQNELTNEKNLINKYAGSNAKNIQIAVTEYGINALTSPANFPDYHKSLDAAISIANTLRIIIQAKIPIAEKHYLISYANSVAPGTQAYVNSQAFANNALVSGPANNATIQPGAYVMEAYSKLLYSNLVSSNITNNPIVSFGGGNYPTLETLATTDGKGDEALLVLNLSLDNSVKANVQSSSKSYKNAETYTLGANNSMAFNTLEDPNIVGFVIQKAKLKNGELLVSFPPNSLSILRLSK